MTTTPKLEHLIELAEAYGRRVAGELADTLTAAPMDESDLYECERAFIKGFNRGRFDDEASR